MGGTLSLILFGHEGGKADQAKRGAMGVGARLIAPWAGFPFVVLAIRPGRDQSGPYPNGFVYLPRLCYVVQYTVAFP